MLRNIVSQSPVWWSHRGEAILLRWLPGTNLHQRAKSRESISISFYFAIRAVSSTNLLSEDDLPQDFKVLTIHDQQPVLATYFLLGGSIRGFATISKVPLYTPSHVVISLSSYK